MGTIRMELLAARRTFKLAGTLAGAAYDSSQERHGRHDLNTTLQGHTGLVTRVTLPVALLGDLRGKRAVHKPTIPAEHAMYRANLRRLTQLNGLPRGWRFARRANE